MRSGLLCISALHFVTRESFCLHCNSLTICRNEVLVALGRSPCLEHKGKRIRLPGLCPLVDSSERSHWLGTLGLRNANKGSPPFVKLVYVRTHIRETSCYHDAKEKASEDDFLCERSCCHAVSSLLISC